MEYLLISDAAKRVQVESHVLRYWEEELKLPIKRNEAGHRYYTSKDIERFMQIKSMKERGLQLKAIKMILKDGKLDVLPMETAKEGMGEITVEEDCKEEKENTGLAIEIVNTENIITQEQAQEEKAQKLQWLLKQLIKETLEENNKELCRDIRDGVVKELDYQFRCQEERETEREKQREQRNEEYYQRMDQLLRKKSGRLRKQTIESEKREEEKKEEKKVVESEVQEVPNSKEVKEIAHKEKMILFKKKRHLFS